MRHAVILAGGSGVRFWPLSRRNRPKQFLPLGGEVSLLRATFDRLRSVLPVERIWLVTAAAQSRRVRSEIPELDSSHILREPQARNTAPAIYWAALAARAQDSRANLLVVPADAWVPQRAPYRHAVRAALSASATLDRLVLIGVKPTRAEVGYGYIEPGSKLARGPAREVVAFEEKPNRRRARRFFSGRRHLWNCGIFAWRADVFIEAVRQHLPSLARAFAPLERGSRAARTLEEAYARAPSISVDYGVLERADNVAVVPASFPWDDLGSWRALERLGGGGAYTRGSVVEVESPGLIAWAEAGTIAVLGVPEVVVVHTTDATLVVAKDRAQEVREVVDRLERKPETRKLVEG